MIKKLTEPQFKKKLDSLSSTEKDSLLLFIFKESKVMQESLAFYFEGKSYRDAVLENYEEKITKLFNPSERRLLSTGVDVGKIKNVIAEAESVFFTENEILSFYYKALLYLHISSEAVSFLEMYGGGPDEIYNISDEYFGRACTFIKDYIGKESGAGTGLAGDEDLSLDFWIDHSSDLKNVINTASSVGESLADSMLGSFDLAEKSVKAVYKEL